MAVCIPRHIACNWYTPEFIAGAEGCTLPVADENRSRLLQAGTLFRSIGAGTSTNNIKIKIIQSAGSPHEVTLEVYVSDVLEETHTVEQYLGSPLIDGIPAMRTKLVSGPNPSNLITMPTIDVQEAGTGTFDDFINIWDSNLDGGAYLSEILTTTALAGGVGYESDDTSLDAIRTGPAYTMAYINNSELQSEEGVVGTLGATRYWNGACWKSFDPVVPDCAGSPPDCGIEPDVPDC